MKRYHLAELSDQPWCPKLLLDSATDFLQYFENLSNVFGSSVPYLRRALEKSGTRRILDLCSGGGGPWPGLYQRFQKEECFPLSVCLTDKNPNIESVKICNASSNGLQYYPRSIDAIKIPGNLDGFRTFFNAVHHFSPDEVQMILNDAIRKNRGIGIFEATERNVLAICQMIFVLPLIVLTLTPLIRPFRLSRLFWTYILPLLPLIITFDGIISSLRTYSIHELEGMICNLDLNHYTWEIGQEDVKGLPRKVTYLIGYPSEQGVGQPAKASSRRYDDPFVAEPSIFRDG